MIVDLAPDLRKRVRQDETGRNGICVTGFYVSYPCIYVSYTLSYLSHLSQERERREKDQVRGQVDLEP